MEKTSTPILPDWIVVITRWVFIIALSVWLILMENMNWPMLLIFILAGIGNTGATMLLAAGRLTPGSRLVSVVGDFFFAHLLFLASIGWGWELIWLGLLPLISASIYYQWIGAGVVILLNTLFQGILVLQTASREDTLLMVGIILSVDILVGLCLAYASMGWVSKNPPLTKPDLKGESASGIIQDAHRQTLYTLISELSATLNLHKVLETSLDLGSIALAELGANVERLASAVMLFTGEDTGTPLLSVSTARRLLTTDKDLSLPGNQGILAQVIEDGTAHLLHEPRTDPELRNIIGLHECQSVYVLPLRMGLDAYGVLLFAHPQPDFFTGDCCEVLEIVRNQTTIAIQNARLYQALEQERNRMMEIQEESRRKLARDLHDGPTQSISAIAMRVNFARRLMDRDPKTASQELYRIEDLARRTTKEIRHMLFTLRPLVLESQGLVAALEMMAEKMDETYSQGVTIQVDPNLVEQLEPGKQTVIFYIVEEAVNNARKHANAEHIWIRLQMLQDGLSQLEIEDDGEGFDTSSVELSYESRGSLGMINLRERADLISGVLQLDSEIGRGTRVKVLIPLTEEAADRLRSGV